MPNSPSAKKRDRQNRKRRLQNRARRGAVRSLSRTVQQTAESGNGPAASDAYKSLQKRVDQVAAKGTIHKRTAARIKSRLARRVHAATKAG